MNRHRRRLVQWLAAVAAAHAGASGAQATARVYRLAILVESDGARRRLDLAVPALATMGYREGVNLQIERRTSGADAGRLAAYAAELVASKPDIIVCSGARVAATLRDATMTIPIVMASASDPVGLGLVKSLSHPGGNLTGLADARLDAALKRLQLLKEAFPSLQRVAVWMEPDVPDARPEVALLEGAAGRLGIELRALAVTGPTEFDTAARTSRQWGAQAIYVANGPLATQYRRDVVARVADLRVPGTYPTVDHVDAGGLMTYGVSNADVAARAATYVDRILKGAKPADLPIEQPTRLQLVLNLRAAAAIGISFPAAVLARADEVRQ